jgi:hypothetical protein
MWLGTSVFLGAIYHHFSTYNIIWLPIERKGQNFNKFLPKSCHSKFDNAWKHHEKKLKLPLKTKAYGLSPTHSIKNLENDKWPYHNCQRSLFMKLVKTISPSLMCSFAPNLISFPFLFVCLSCHNIPSYKGASPSSFTYAMNITYPLASSPSFCS